MVARGVDETVTGVAAIDRRSDDLNQHFVI
jgi:hypothetical protein